MNHFSDVTFFQIFFSFKQQMNSTALFSMLNSVANSQKYGMPTCNLPIDFYKEKYARVGCSACPLGFNIFTSLQQISLNMEVIFFLLKDMKNCWYCVVKGPTFLCKIRTLIFLCFLFLLISTHLFCYRSMALKGTNLIWARYYPP